MEIRMMIPTSIFACCRSLCHAAFGGGMGRFVVVRAHNPTGVGYSERGERVRKRERIEI